MDRPGTCWAGIDSGCCRCRYTHLFLGLANIYIQLLHVLSDVVMASIFKYCGSSRRDGIHQQALIN